MTFANREADLPYPRLCAHRGFSAAAPENTLPAFLAAIELGAQEIEFDLRETADGEPVSLHDSTLDRCSNGTGNVGGSHTGAAAAVGFRHPLQRSLPRHEAADL